MLSLKEKTHDIGFPTLKLLVITIKMFMITRLYDKSSDVYIFHTGIIPCVLCGNQVQMNMSLFYFERKSILNGLVKAVDPLSKRNK